jgi:hypothetical protein
LENKLSASEKEFIRQLIDKTPSESEIKPLLLSLSKESRIDAALDRNAAIIAAGAVDQGLQLAILTHTADDPALQLRNRDSFDQKISTALKYRIIDPNEYSDIQIIRNIRNAFAHAMNISFSDPEIAAMVSKMRACPITSWTSYFAPAFSTRNRFAIVCAQYSVKLHNYKPSK